MPVNQGRKKRLLGALYAPLRRKILSDQKRTERKPAFYGTGGGGGGGGSHRATNKSRITSRIETQEKRRIARRIDIRVEKASHQEPKGKKTEKS